MGLAAAWVLATLAPSVGRAGAPRVEGLEAHWEGAVLAVCYRVADVLTAETSERIQSGMPVAFEHTVEVVDPRAVPLWPAKILARTRIESSVRFDSLTGRYELQRTIRTRQKGCPPVEEADASTTDDPGEMAEWMTVVPAVRVFDRSFTRRAPSKLRVESTVGRRFVLLVFPSAETVSAEIRLEP